MQRDSFKVIKEVILGSLPFKWIFPFLSSEPRVKKIFAKGKFSLCLLPVVTLDLGMFTK